MLITLVLLTFIVLLVFGMPVVFAMAIASAWAPLLRDNIPWSFLVHRTYVGVDSWVLLAVPLFIWAGLLMEIGGIGQPLMRLATALVGWARGGVGMATVVTEMLFSGISGSTVADVAAITSMTMPIVRKSGYAPEEFVAIRCAAAAMGILIPPCILMVLFAELVNTSLAALFFAGFLPAFFVAALLMVTIYYRSVHLRMRPTDKFSGSELIAALKGSLIASGLPLLIFGGILGGFCTATEAAALACVYSLAVGVFIYRAIGWESFVHSLRRTAVLTGIVLLLIGFSNIFTYILSVEGLTDMLKTAMGPVSSHHVSFMIALAIIFIALSAFIEPLPAGLILIPIFWPIAKGLGINVLYFVNMLVMAGGIGLFLPPMGVGLVIGCATAGVEVGKVLPRFLIYLAVLLGSLLVLILFPVFTTLVPDALGMRY